MIEIDTIIFDLDGTLVDTERAASKAIYGCFEKWGLTITPNDAAFVTGRTWASAFEYLFRRYRLPLSSEEASQQMVQAYRDSIESCLDIVPGSAAAVRDLAQQYTLGLVSGSYRSEIIWALDRLGVRDLFQVILGAEDYPQSKPAPDGYLKALKILDRQAQRSLVFEDSAPGIASARAAGMWVVAITGTNHFKHDTSLAHHHIPDLQEVTAPWVAKLSACLTEK
jgi:HAD superfamily hydrolase (TIGR01509 family)